MAWDFSACPRPRACERAVNHRARARSGSGRFRWIVLGGVVLAFLGLAFALGLLVGKQSARQSPSLAADASHKSAAAPRRGGLGEAHAERAAARQEKLTFYQTLTAPLSPVSAPSRPDVAPKPEVAAKPRPKPDATPDRAQDRVTSRSETESSELRETTQEWTVQVGVFKNAQQAERVRRELADSGFPVRLTPTTGDDGQPRYRVRVGAYRTRDEALKTAERVRADRSLPTYVTAK
jgi:cell division protein FtsN